MITLSRRYAEALAELGLKPGDRVAAQVEKSVEALMLYFGAIRAGAIFLPLDTAYASAELAYFLGDAEPKLLICDPTRRDGSASARRLGDASYARESQTELNERNAGRRLIRPLTKVRVQSADNVLQGNGLAVQLGESVLTSLPLAFHKMAANAVNYRALSAVQVTWRIEAGKLPLMRGEQAGPRVQRPPDD